MIDVTGFEKRLGRLEEIARALEADGVDLAQALALFEEGIDQLRAAADDLARAEAHVQRLVERSDGTFEVIEPRD